MSKKLRSFALPIALSLVAPGIGTALGSTLSAAALGAIGAGVGSGVNTKLSGGSIGDSLKSAAIGGAGSYVGGQLGGKFLGSAGNVADALEGGLGADLGSAVAQGIGGTAANASLGGIAGSFAGSNLASSLVPQSAKNASGEGASPVYRPAREVEKSAPSGLQGLGSLTNQQLSTNVATGGVYGGGAGPDEQDFFLNQINRRLVDDAGAVDQNLDEINPIENSYLSQLGLGGYGDASSLLEAISKKRKPA